MCDDDMFASDIRTVYFTKSSPDFINGRGEVIAASQQVDALAQAQGIGEQRYLTRLRDKLTKTSSLPIDIHHSMF